MAKEENCQNSKYLFKKNYKKKWLYSNVLSKRTEEGFLNGDTTDAQIGIMSLHV